ncbi:hypothetical protein EDB80DRAFT_692884 [Ilyonectria destructans]|nr:hypothetical protein EDB80DRAFT_692884 [Ilyonectria destructans]
MDLLTFPPVFTPEAAASPLYEPVNPTTSEIRVLQIPADGSEGLGLVTVSLDHNPEYAALSYVWGEKKNLRKIVVQGQEKEVTLNLASVLRRIRHGNWFGEASGRVRSYGLGDVILSLGDLLLVTQSFKTLNLHDKLKRGEVLKRQFLSRPIWDTLTYDLNWNSIFSITFSKNTFEVHLPGARDLMLLANWQWAMIAGELNATDPKDYVYGLLAISQLSITPNNIWGNTPRALWRTSLLGPDTGSLFVWGAAIGSVPRVDGSPESISGIPSWLAIARRLLLQESPTIGWIMATYLLFLAGVLSAITDHIFRGKGAMLGMRQSPVWEEVLFKSLHGGDLDGNWSMCLGFYCNEAQELKYTHDLPRSLISEAQAAGKDSGYNDSFVSAVGEALALSRLEWTSNKGSMNGDGEESQAANVHKGGSQAIRPRATNTRRQRPVASRGVISRPIRAKGEQEVREKASVERRIGKPRDRRRENTRPPQDVARSRLLPRPILPKERGREDEQEGTGFVSLDKRELSTREGPQIRMSGEHCGTAQKELEQAGAKMVCPRRRPGLGRSRIRLRTQGQARVRPIRPREAENEEANLSRLEKNVDSAQGERQEKRSCCSSKDNPPQRRVRSAVRRQRKLDEQAEDLTWCALIPQERKVSTVPNFYRAFHDANTLLIWTCMIHYHINIDVAEMDSWGTPAHGVPMQGKDVLVDHSRQPDHSGADDEDGAIEVEPDNSTNPINEVTLSAPQRSKLLKEAIAGLKKRQDRQQCWIERLGKLFSPLNSALAALSQRTLYIKNRWGMDWMMKATCVLV